MLSGRGVNDESAYRRGTLFGFTLAEIVLLIIFALLLAMAALVSIKQKRIAELEKAANGLVQVPAAEAKLIEVVRDAYQAEGEPTPPPDDLFRDLRLAQEAKRRAAGAAKDVDVRRAMDQLARSLTEAGLDPAVQVANLAKGVSQVADQARKEKQNPGKVLSDLFVNLAILLKQKDEAEKKVDDLSKQLKEAKEELTGRGNNDLPQILVIPTDNSFRLGEATLESEFRARLVTEYAPKLEEAGKKYNVEVIEIVGHTDELPIKDVQSRLDSNLLPFLNGKGAERDVVAGDNAGLGLARAAAVQRVLREIKGLENFRILPMSAGQVVDTDQSVSTGAKPADDPARRRIEIRMRRLK